MKIKNFVTAVTIAAALLLTGCAENRENINANDSAGSASGAVSAYSDAVSETGEPVSSAASETGETESSLNVPKPVESAVSVASEAESKPGEKPVASVSSTVENPVVSTSSAASSKVEKPVVSASSTTSKPAEKPVVSSASSTAEQPVHTHKFTNATCTEPATCITCGATKGDPRGHNFTKATCETPAICTVCGTTQGTVASHSYINGTCTNCGKKDPNYVQLSACEKYGHDYFNGENIDSEHRSCGRCGEIHQHVWNVTTTTTEPKWCREMHVVYDFGFDATLAKRFLNTEESTYIIFKDMCKENGVNGSCGSATIDVEVWGTETYETKKCKECGLIIDSSAIRTITPLTVTPDHPLGEWRFKDGKNRRLIANGCDFNTLFYDPYNIPQTVIDNIYTYRNR